MQNLRKYLPGWNNLSLWSIWFIWRSFSLLQIVLKQRETGWTDLPGVSHNLWFETISCCVLQQLQKVSSSLSLFKIMCYQIEKCQISQNLKSFSKIFNISEINWTLTQFCVFDLCQPLREMAVNAVNVEGRQIQFFGEIQNVSTIRQNPQTLFLSFFSNLWRHPLSRNVSWQFFNQTRWK